MVSVNGRNARLQLRLVWMHGSHPGDFLLQISTGKRAAKILGRQQTGNNNNIVY